MLSNPFNPFRVVAPPASVVPGAYYTPDGSSYYVTPDGLNIYISPV